MFDSRSLRLLCHSALTPARDRDDALWRAQETSALRSSTRSSLSATLRRMAAADSHATDDLVNDPEGEA